MADKINKASKTTKIITKRPSKSQRIHIRRLKQEARDAGTPYRAPTQI
jgi:hypothetical protein